MKQVRKRPPSPKLWVRLVCSVTLVILGMLSLVGWVLYGYASSAVNETMRDSTSSALTRAQSYLDMRMESLMQRIVYSDCLPLCQPSVHHRPHRRRCEGLSGDILHFHQSGRWACPLERSGMTCLPVFRGAFFVA